MIAVLFRSANVSGLSMNTESGGHISGEILLRSIAG